MTITQLTYFKELAKIQHITKTAQFLHISQPSLSSALKSLEEELGVKLFDRNGKLLVLNDNGQLFLQYVEKALSSLARKDAGPTAPPHGLVLWRVKYPDFDTEEVLSREE